MSKLLTISELAEKLGVGKVTIYNWMKAEKAPLPKPLALSPRVVRWREADIEAWLETRQQASTGT
jgi:prophage regulatory protein